MTTVSKSAPAQSVDIQLAGQTYQQSMQGLTTVVNEKVADTGVVTLQPGELSVVQVQAGKQYKLRKPGNATQKPDDLIAVRHGDALHVRYADGSVVHFEDFYSTCTSADVCSVSLASDSAAGVTLSADMAFAGPVADDGLLVYAHGNTEVLITMAQDQSSLMSAFLGADSGATLTYMAPSPLLGASLFALGAAGVAFAGTSAAALAEVLAVPFTLEERNALKKISTAADANNASGAINPEVVALTATDFRNARVTGVNAGNIGAINSALDTAEVTAGKTDTVGEVQAIVNAYNAILDSADGSTTANTTPALTGEQYAAVGVTGIAAGNPTDGSALKLLDEMVDKSAASDVSTVAKLQAKVDAATHLLAAAGGSSTDAAKLTLTDLQAMGLTNVTADNIDAVRAAIKATVPDTAIDQLSEVKAIVDTAIAGVAPALAKISAAAGANNAGGSASPQVLALNLDDFSKASVAGVTAGNIGAISSALDTVEVTAGKTDTVGEVQAIVKAYNAVLASADGTAGNTPTSLSGEQYAAIGITGVASGAPTAGSALALLDTAVDVSPQSAVNTAVNLQKMADAAAHVMTAAGLPSGSSNPLTVDDLIALGVTGLTANNAQAVINAIVAQMPDSNVDTLAKLQAVATAAEAKAATALATIIAADSANTAETPALPVATYTDAGVTFVPPTGVTTSTMLGAVNSALDTGTVGTPYVSSTATVQSVVNAYNAILASADGTAGNTDTALTGNQYLEVGVTGVSGASAPVAGTNVFLLNSVVDAKSVAAVDSASELQTLATAATHVMAAANHGTTNVTVAELTALGLTGDFTIQATLDAINAAIHNSAATAVDTQAELQTLANVGALPVISSLLGNATSLDVTSNLLLTSTSALQVGTGGHIHITATGGPGYGGEAVAGNSQDIDLSTTAGRAMVSIDATGTKITINPGWDLDLGANYSISIDAGSFVSTSASHVAANAVGSMAFTTVTPGQHFDGHTVSTDAHTSQAMDSTGALVASKSWLNIGSLGNNTSSPTLLGSLDTGSYALVLENYATTPANTAQQNNGIKAHDTNVSVTSFGADDLIYFDAQANNASTQSFDASLTNLINGKGHGGVAGQTAMEIGLVSSPTQNGSSAQILMGFLGNTNNLIFPVVYTDANDGPGFGTFLHSSPVIMG